MLEIPIPTAIPTGAVREKNVAIIAIDVDLNCACKYQQKLIRMQKKTQVNDKIN
jgi:ABC-type cobalamin/Fe3+-siderophores transport system ATPase subunit